MGRSWEVCGDSHLEDEDGGRLMEKELLLCVDEALASGAAVLVVTVEALRLGEHLQRLHDGGSLA